ncbi:MAG: hypothetical protein V3U59_00350, partial [Gammaproteobacteria bacterium]
CDSEDDCDSDGSGMSGDGIIGGGVDGDGGSGGVGVGGVGILGDGDGLPDDGTSVGVDDGDVGDCTVVMQAASSSATLMTKPVRVIVLIANPLILNPVGRGFTLGFGFLSAAEVHTDTVIFVPGPNSVKP